MSVVSTTLPAYITATRSARPAMTPRSWVTRMTDMPSRCRRPSISSRICFWMVTSSAVVGSSAISSFGSQASAIAIITRCRMPPENWCGYSPTRSLAFGSTTRSSTSTARSIAWVLETSRCSSTVSAICLPTVIVGFSEVSGSWKIIPISLPRTLRMSSWLSLLISRPASVMLPATIDPPVGSRFMMDSAVIVLPQPDSPTTPSVSPGSTCNDTPSTAWTTPSRSLIWVWRSLISSSGATNSPFLPALQPCLERVPQRVADEVECDTGQDDRDARRVDQPPVVTALQVREAVGEHRAPVGGGRLDAEPEEAEAGQDQDAVGGAAGGVPAGPPEGVRHAVPGGRRPAGAAGHLDRLHVLPGAQAERL